MAMSHRECKKMEASLTPMQRAEDLLSKMTIEEEKAVQLSCLYTMPLLGANGPIRSQLDAQLKQAIGHIAGLGTFGHKTPERIARMVNTIQLYLVTETPLKILAIFHN
jgi:beta-xylosidase